MIQGYPIIAQSLDKYNEKGHQVIGGALFRNRLHAAPLKVGGGLGWICVD